MSMQNQIVKIIYKTLNTCIYGKMTALGVTALGVLCCFALFV